MNRRRTERAGGVTASGLFLSQTKVKVMITSKLLFNGSLVLGTLAIILLIASIMANEPVLVLCNVALLAVSIVCALLNYKMLP